MQKWILILLLLEICLSEITAQDLVIVADTQNIVFELGEVQVVGEKNRPFKLEIDAREMAVYPGKDVSQLLVMLSGVNFTAHGQKNESMVSVRGFDLRQVPVYMDGVPVYVSYDGYADLGRMLVGGLSKISVTRGETSLLLGPNAMGGAINLVSRQPASAFEMDLAGGVLSDSRAYAGRTSSLNLGSRQDKFYVQTGWACVDNEPFMLPNGVIQANSQQRDMNVSLKAGFTPRATDSYVLSAHYQGGSKGVPSYKGEDPFNRERFWQFPVIREKGIHFNSKTQLGRDHYLQTRLYYEQNLSELKAYDDSTFLSRDFGASFTSVYDDQTLGGAIIYALNPGTKHELKTAFHAIYDHHREHNTYPVEETMRHFRDLSFSLGLEDHIRLTDRLQARAGLGIHKKTNLQADDFDSGTDSVFAFTGHNDRSLNFLTGLEYDAGKMHKFSVNLSRKNRFPTMKDRYSYRLGRSVPNPDLVSESAWNADLAYAFIPVSDFLIRTTLFYSHLQNTIQAVYGIDPDDSGVYQFQNTGKARFYGWEADLVWNPLTTMKSGLQYTFTERENLENPDIRFTNVPRHKWYGYVNYTFFERWTVGLSGMYNSERISTSDGAYGTDPFLSMDFRTSLSLFSSFSLEFSVHNILDAEYSYMEGYTAPGRQFRTGFRYLFR